MISLLTTSAVFKSLNTQFVWAYWFNRLWCTCSYVCICNFFFFFRLFCFLLRYASVNCFSRQYDVSGSGVYFLFWFLILLFYTIYFVYFSWLQFFFFCNVFISFVFGRSVYNVSFFCVVKYFVRDSVTLSYIRTFCFFFSF